MGMAGHDTKYAWVGSDAWTTTDVFNTPPPFTSTTSSPSSNAMLRVISLAAIGAVGVRPSSPLVNSSDPFPQRWQLAQAGLERLMNMPNGSFSRINTYTPFAYEAVWAFAHAIYAVRARGEDPRNGS